MTRKQALQLALDALTENEAKAKIKEILDDMPFTGWTEQTIFDTLDQFVIDNGSNPTATDFKKKGLPPHTVIKLRFGITLKEFLDKYYPTKRYNNSQFYYKKSKEEWQVLFIEEYHKIKPGSSDEYDKKRPAQTPSRHTISHMFGITGWHAWLDFCGLIPFTSKKTEQKPLKISSTLTLATKDRVYVYAKNNDTNNMAVLQSTLRI